MKIAIVGTTSWGIVNFRGPLIEALCKEGHQVFAFSLDYDEASRNFMTRLGGVPVDYTFSRSGMNPIVEFKNTILLARKLKKIAPDLIFSYFAKPVVFATWAAAFAGIKHRIGMLEGLGYVFTDDVSVSFKKKLLRRMQIFLYRVTFPLLKSLILLNPDDKIDLIDKPNIFVKNIHILGGIGLTLSEYPYTVPPVDQISFIFVGRLIAEKGILTFLDAACHVKERFPTVTFYVVGAIDESSPGSLTSDALLRYVKEGTIIYPGHVDNIKEWITKSSVFVLPSYYREGVPRSTQEAMAIGRPVITTDMPGCRETVINDANGFLVPPRSVDALVDKMTFFIKNPEKIITLGKVSHEIAQEKFDASVVNKRLLQLILNN